MSALSSDRCLPARGWFVFAILLVLLVAGCRGTDGVQDRDEADAGGEADVDADTDIDGDADTDLDTDGDGDTDTDTDTGIQWVTIPGGRYIMQYHNDEKAHEVDVPEFQIGRTEVTIAQYRECVDAGVCPAPIEGNFDSWARDLPYPVNRVDWHEARLFCEWIGARLPSEAEWEYAASNGGLEVMYPWGDEELSCDYAVYDDGGPCSNHLCPTGCGKAWMWEVCSKPLGNTEHGLCDMAGNLSEWVEDDYHESFEGAPTDGSAWVDEPREEGYRIHRGGDYEDENVDVRSRPRTSSIVASSGIGFRPARSIP